VIGLVEASGASQKVLTDLGKGVSCLESFAAMPVEEFARFLVLADEYHRTGTIANFVKPPAKSRSSTPKTPPKPKVPKLTDDEGHQIAIDRFKALCEKAEQKQLTEDLLNAEMSWFDASLDKTNILQVVKKLGIAGMKGKGDAIEELKRRALSRMENALNTSFHAGPIPVGGPQ
jgi:hypothetical protein